jgi:hypothetical protein
MASDLFVELSTEEYTQRLLGGWTEENSEWGFSIFKEQKNIEPSKIEIIRRNVKVRSREPELEKVVEKLKLEIHFRVILEKEKFNLEEDKLVEHRLMSDQPDEIALRQSYACIMRRLHDIKIVPSALGMGINHFYKALKDLVRDKPFLK